MSAPPETDAQNELANEAISRAIGDELRRTREAQGLSRTQFVKRLPSGIGDRTLLAYEHGLRRITALRLIELCRGLEVDAPTVLGRALQRAQLHIETLPLKVDLRALAKDYSPLYRPLAQWAKNALNEHKDGVAEIPPEVVKNMALFMGRDKAQVTEYLARFLPEEGGASGDLRWARPRDPRRQLRPSSWSAGTRPPAAQSARNYDVFGKRMAGHANIS